MTYYKCKNLNPTRILVVHHGYPPEHEAGSEVYTKNLTDALNKHTSVSVFYRTRKSQSEEIKYWKKDGIQHFQVEEPNEYEFIHIHESVYIDRLFKIVLEQVQPLFVYFGHLNHLSLNLVNLAKKFGSKIIFTLHDYWLRCARGQLIHRTGSICEPQKLGECKKCIQKKYTQKGHKRPLDECESLLNYRKNKIAQIFQKVDYFIAPTHFLRGKFIEVGCPPEKILYRDYGFNKELFVNFDYNKHKQRIQNRNIAFGYCGTAIPSKGLDVLIKAAAILQQNQSNFPKKKKS